MTQDGHNAINSTDNPFWRYSLSVYGQKNCADFLLHVQNKYGLDINVLLFIGWLAHEKRQFIITPEHSCLIQGFQKEITENIRHLRIKTKAFNNSKFYQSLLDLELKAEYFEQVRLISLKEQMPFIHLDFKRTITEGFDRYLEFELGCINSFTEGDDWLQTLIQYLQPAS